MDDFDAAQFQNEYATSDGKRLWALLNRDDVIARMETASDLGQPALQPIEDLLLAELGETILQDRFKQMTGRMVRQILERRGFEHEASDVRLNSVPFYKASRYRRRDLPTVFVFKNSADARDLCLSAIRKPELPALPAGRWLFVNVLTSGLKAQIGYGFDLKAMAKQVAKGPVRHRMQRVMRAG